MPLIEFTPNLKRHVECPAEDIAAESLAELLAEYFTRWPDVRGYVLDDQNAVRKHVKILIDGRNIADRERQSDRLKPSSHIHVLQALSGG
jgi:hypothetical protein